MWNLKPPKPAKLIIGILAADADCLDSARQALTSSFGIADLASDVWRFTQTNYYSNELGDNPLRQFISLERLADPAHLPEIKLQANELEKRLADQLPLSLPRPVNLDPGLIEPSKLILASTKNYSHRIYIGQNYPDYTQQCYFDFFSKVRTRLLEQLKSQP